ncbi:right-handed parallel beta-helix repeat-containing protein [Candidatus Poribacteria bacterium]|nr:right-handed parallel beta-helix repeat-containing protein [Candidatus Poribacteria bacterium]
MARAVCEENEAYGNGGPGIWFCEVRNSVIRRNKVRHNGGDGIHQQLRR